MKIFPIYGKHVPKHQPAVILSELGALKPAMNPMS
jgi:hypothetical protein